MQFYKKGESAKFEFENQDGEYKAEYLTTTNRFYPGVAYHFSPNNILDIYGGAELLFGWNKEKDQVLYDDKYSGGAGSMTSTQFGGGLFIGLQAFIADLPVAVGIEYGFHGYGNHGLKYKQETEDGDVYQINPDMFKNINVEGGAKKMGASTSNFGQQVRFTISYYFNR